MPHGKGERRRIGAEQRADSRYGVPPRSSIMTCIMANIQSSLQEIRETWVIASTCLGLSLSFLMRVIWKLQLLCNSVQ